MGLALPVSDKDSARGRRPCRSLELEERGRDGGTTGHWRRADTARASSPSDRGSEERAAGDNEERARQRRTDPRVFVGLRVETVL